eukprot:2085704-Prymnesium_polylepis.3
MGERSQFAPQLSGSPARPTNEPTTSPLHVTISLHPIGGAPSPEPLNSRKRFSSPLGHALACKPWCVCNTHHSLASRDLLAGLCAICKVLPPPENSETTVT